MSASPYVMPFWSYRRIEDHAVLTNHITAQRATAPWASVQALHTLYDSPFADSTIPAVARDLELVFENKQSADSWFYSRDDRRAKELPKIEQIELTNRCPYTCQMCPRTLEMDRGLGDMTLELFGSIIEQIRGHCDFVALHHFGESLLHKGLADAVAMARRQGVRTGLACNPPSLKPSIARSLLEAGVANLVMSLDSLDPEVYMSIRGRAARLDKADENLREMVRLRDLGDHDTTLTLQMIRMRANEDEAAAFLAYCKDVGVDRGLVVRLERWDFDDDVVAGIGEHTSPGYTSPCSRPSTSVAVLWDGRVVPCCHDYNGEVVLGDLRVDTLQSIWEQPAARRFRERNDEMALCKKCAFSKAFREGRRAREGFLRFHQEPEGRPVRWEWFNPASLERRNSRQWFDGFDVMTGELSA